ncbi:MAG: hypothetical protein IPP47_00480 [Bryobacterales bacterium]|nr:hypothetical protein [Bryobacterales bacterium]
MKRASEAESAIQAEVVFDGALAGRHDDLDAQGRPPRRMGLNFHGEQKNIVQPALAKGGVQIDGLTFLV